VEAPAPVGLADFIESDEFADQLARVEGEAINVPHWRGWAQAVEAKRYVGLIAFRGAAKSTFAKATIAHLLRSHRAGAFEGTYYSATTKLARKHLRKLKMYVDPLARRWGWGDTTQGRALLQYQRKGAWFSYEPSGTDEAARGGHVDHMVLDDLVDPKKLTSVAEVERVLQAVKRRIIPLLKGGQTQILYCGTPLVEGDVTQFIEQNPMFTTLRLPAIVGGVPTWPERYPIEVLDDVRRMIGGKAFGAEFQLEYVAELDSFIDPVLLKACVAGVGGAE